MGEKERGAATADDPGAAEGGVLNPREHGSGLATGRTAGGISHEDDWGNQKAAGGKPTKEQVAMDREAGDGEGQQDIAIGDPGVNGNFTPDPAETAIVKSKSNITNNREAAPGGGDGDDDGDPQARATNLNTSRSNSYRTGGPGGGAGDDGDGSPEERASNLNLSKSNINRLGGQNDAGAGAGLAIGDQGAVEPEKKPRPK